MHDVSLTAIILALLNSFGRFLTIQIYNYQSAANDYLYAIYASKKRHLKTLGLDLWTLWKLLARFEVNMRRNVHRSCIEHLLDDTEIVMEKDEWEKMIVEVIGKVVSFPSANIEVQPIFQLTKQASVYEDETKWIRKGHFTK